LITVIFSECGVHILAGEKTIRPERPFGITEWQKNLRRLSTCPWFFETPLSELGESGPWKPHTVDEREYLPQFLLPQGSTPAYGEKAGEETINPPIDLDVVFEEREQMHSFEPPTHPVDLAALSSFTTLAYSCPHAIELLLDILQYWRYMLLRLGVFCV